MARARKKNRELSKTKSKQKNLINKASDLVVFLSNSYRRVYYSTHILYLEFFSLSLLLIMASQHIILEKMSSLYLYVIYIYYIKKNVALLQLHIIYVYISIISCF
jgi:hypothetical protein